jgi:hypothetical protein
MIGGRKHMAASFNREAWLKQTIGQSILASLQREITYDDLLDEEWKQFAEFYQPGDEIWTFCTPPETWTMCPHCGMQGYALVRGDQLIDEILTSIS